MFLKNVDKSRQIIVENKNFTRFTNEEINEKIVFNINDAIFNTSLVSNFLNN